MTSYLFENIIRACETEEELDVLMTLCSEDLNLTMIPHEHVCFPMMSKR